MNYPDLSNSRVICLDIETKDPNLKTSGSGVYRKDGYIIGIAIANDQGFSEYYPLKHPDTTKEEREKNEKYLQKILSLDIPKLGANLLYDLDWICNFNGWTVNGRYNDVQIAEPLIDENRDSYSLNSLALKYLGKEKFQDEIKEYCDKKEWKGLPVTHLWKMPGHVVRKYAIVDVLEPIDIFKKQVKILKEQNLFELYRMEIGQIPLLLQMKKTGIRVDGEKVDESSKELERRIRKGEQELFEKYNKFNINSGKQIAKILDKLNVKYNLTEKGNPALDKTNLERLAHPIGRQILEIKKYKTLYNNFFHGSLLKFRVNERIHCNFHPLKISKFGDNIAGTKSGRYSSSNPNLQQIPSKKDEMSRIARQVFLPEEGYLLGKLDYSQIEFRIIAHYATGHNAEEIREKYKNDPNTDYHKIVEDWLNIERKQAKGINFGLAYCMGVKTCANNNGWSIDEAKDLFNRYNENLPFLKTTRNSITQVGKGRGFIRTILNRRARVDERMKKDKKEYTLFNRLIQGSAADILKKSMVNAYNKGLFNILMPHLTVHDELVVSMPKTKEGVMALKELKHTMENSVKLKVPLIVDTEVGSNWGNCTEENYTNLLEEYTLC